MPDNGFDLGDADTCLHIEGAVENTVTHLPEGIVDYARADAAMGVDTGICTWKCDQRSEAANRVGNRNAMGTKNVCRRGAIGKHGSEGYGNLE